jgi:restriction system protein
VAVALTLLGFALLGTALVAVVRGRRQPLNRFRADPDSAPGGDARSEAEVERLVGASFEAEGYAVEYASGEGPVCGVDLVLHKGQERTLVQCQQWRARSVGVASIREFYGAMEASGASRGIVFTGGEFTTDAHDFANGRKLELRNGRALRTVLRSAGG